MTDDLISRQAAIESLGEEPEVWTGKDEYEMGLNNQWHYDKKAIMSVPAQERKKGKWVMIMDEPTITFDECKCSVCGVVEYFNKGWKKFSYCPNCGARMKGEENEAN